MSTARDIIRLAVAALAVAAASTSAPAAAGVRVVATMPEYAWAARAIGGDLVEARSICPPEQDAHFLSPRPSYARMVAEADLFVTTGLDLELWAPVLLQKAGNSRVMPGAAGYVKAAEGTRLLDVPANADRSQGDVHVFGNPHLHTSPLNMRQVVRNIEAGLARVDPSNAARYRSGADATVRDLDVRTFGEKLVTVIGGDTLTKLQERGKLQAFLAGRQFEGKPLADQLGGWLGRTAPLRGTAIITYHKNWIYLVDLLGLEIAETVEPKPGIPPSPGHVAEVLRVASTRKISTILAVSYFPRDQVESVAARAGARAVIVPFHVGGGGVKDYPSLVDAWVDSLAAALGSAGGTP